MTTIASLRILLGLDSGGVKTGAANVKNELRGVQAQANQTNATLKGIGKGVGQGIGLGAGFGAVQLAAQGAAAAVGLLTESISAAAEEEAGIRRLSATLRENVADFDGNTDAIEHNIEVRQKLGFSDNELRDSLSALSAATGNVAESFKLQSVAQDLARFKGESLAAATDELVKVQAGSFRSLKALGIELPATASKEEALAAIQKVVAGQAEAFGTTAEGAMARAGIAVDNLQEKIGKHLLPAIGKASDAVSTFLDAGGVEQAVSTSFGSVSSAAEVTGGTIRSLSDGMAALDDALHPPTTTLTGMTAALIENSLAIDHDHEAITGLTPAVVAATMAFLAHERVLSAVDYNYGLAGHSLEEFKTGLGGYPTVLLGATGGTDDLSDSLLTAANNANTARAALAGLGFVAAETMKIPGLSGEGPGGGAKKGEGVSLAQSYIDGLALANQNAEKMAQQEGERQITLKGIRDRATADAKSAAAEVARTYHDKLTKAYDDVSNRAHEAYARLHADNLAAIRDVHDHANALLDEQEKAIRGTVDAERARVQSQRDARTLEGLRANVAGASPEDLEAAKRALGDFLADQRIAFLSSDADTKIALLEAEKKKNDDIAAAAVTAENARNDAQVKALNKDLANLKDHLKDVVGAWDKAFADIEKAAKRHHVGDIVGITPMSIATGPKATSAIPAGINPAVAGVGTAAVVNQFTFYLDGIDITDLINIRQAASNSRITSGGIAG